MADESRTEAIHRLKSTAGHINGIVRMLEDDRYCIDVIQQIQAAQRALRCVSEGLLDRYIRTCVTSVVQGDDADRREQLLAEITEIIQPSNGSQRRQEAYVRVEQSLQDR